MTTLRKYLQDQQDIGTNLCGVMEALTILDSDGIAPGAVTSLISVGRSLAETLTRNLDIVNLPEVEA